MGKKHRRRFNSSSSNSNKSIQATLPEPEKRKKGNLLYALLVQVSKITGIPVNNILDFIEIEQEQMADGSKSRSANSTTSAATSSTTGGSEDKEVVVKPTGWQAEGPKCITACGLAGTPTVTFTHEAWQKVEALMNHYTDMEWLAYLVGEKTGDFSWRVTDLRVPKQIAETAHVEVIDDNIDFTGVVGVCHSHHHMSAFFSQEDREFINSNHPLSIVFSKRKGANAIEHKMMARRKLPCGEWYETESGTVLFEQDPSAQTWLDSVKTNIQEKTYTYRRYGGAYYGLDDDDWEYGPNPYWQRSATDKAAADQAVKRASVQQKS